MKRKDPTRAATEAVGYLLGAVGFVLVILYMAIGNILLAQSVLSNMGLGVLARNTSLLLWGGLAAIVVGVIAVVTSGVDVDVE